MSCFSFKLRRRRAVICVLLVVSLLLERALLQQVLLFLSSGVWNFTFVLVEKLGLDRDCNYILYMFFFYVCIALAHILSNFHSFLWIWLGSVQICGACWEQWKAIGLEEQDQVQDHESQGQRRNRLCTWAGMLNGFWLQ